ncbi:hypothetical protein LJC58_07285, partial [Lachnospiraceae bacterium OttesenSCG-928-D06]|nr:hypothetical protein [Lachnospiraceae bacterium OttesenSCG-928-D06]
CIILINTILIAIILSGCAVGSKSLSGKYVSEENKKVYFEFSSKGDVNLCFDKEIIGQGSYNVSGEFLTILLDSGDYQGVFISTLQDKGKSFSLADIENIFSEGEKTSGISFIKEKGFFAKYWLIILLGLSILGYIGNKVEEKTGKTIEELEEDLGEKIEGYHDK